MKKFALLSLAAAAVVAVASLSLPAQAEPRYLATVKTTDGGPYSAPFSLAGYEKSRICLQAKWTQTCFKMGRNDGGNPPFLPDCTKDFVIPPSVGDIAITNQYPTWCTDVAGQNVIVVRNVDGGTADTNVFVDALSPVRY